MSIPFVPPLQQRHALHTLPKNFVARLGVADVTREGMMARYFLKYID